MLVKDGDGTFIDFQWPTFGYFVKSGFAATIGVAGALLLLWVPIVVLWFGFLGALLGGFRR